MVRVFRRHGFLGLTLLLWVGAIVWLARLLGPSGLGWSWDTAWGLAWLTAFAMLACVWAMRQAWVHPRLLKRAESLWGAGQYASEVVDTLAGIHVPVGELAHRVWLLRAKANLALGFRNLAWAESEEAHLARVPFVLRPFLRRYLHARSGAQAPGRVARFWLRVAPDMPSLLWHVAAQHLRMQDPASRSRGWELLLRALPHATEDVLLLEDLMLALLDRLQEPHPEAGSLGTQPGRPELQAAFERVLDALMHRHGHARIGWDRVAPAMHLLHSGRYDEVVALARTLPPDRMPEALWAAMAAAFKAMGDTESAFNTLGRALVHHPTAFRLWMMREDLALELHRHADAHEALAQAEALFRDGGPTEQLREWHTRRAEFAYWVAKDVEEAARHLEHLPTSLDEQGRPPLRLLILLDLGRFEEVHREVGTLLESQPDHVELRLIEAESLGGLGAWETVRKRLDALGTDGHLRADYWHLRGICRAHLGDALGSREDLERSAQMEPGNLRYVLDAGHACADLHEWERSEYHWRHVLRQDDRNEEALTQLAEARRTLHDPNGAKRLLRECLLHHPESTTAQIMLAELEAN